MSKQEKARIQNPIAIPEPTNEVNALWRTCQALKEAVEILQGARGNREAALKVDLEDFRDDLIQGSVSVGSVAPGGATTTLFDLTDTTLDTQIQGSLLYNQNGTQWYPSINALWDENNQQFKFDLNTVMQWLDTTETQYVTGAAFEEVTGGSGAPDPDPYFENVTLLITSENSPLNIFAAQSFTSDIGNATFTWQGLYSQDVEWGYIGPNSQNGTRSVYVRGTSGAFFGGFQGPDLSQPASVGYIPLGFEPFTIEWWIDPTPDVGVGGWNNEMYVYSSRDNGTSQEDNIQLWVRTDGSLGASFLYQNNPQKTAVVFDQLGIGTWTAAQWAQEGWHHYAVTRESDGEFRGWRDGQLLGTTGQGLLQSRSSLSLVQSNITPTPVVLGGQMRNGVPNTASYSGYIDDFRITKGVARYTGASYTVPSKPFQGTAFGKSFIWGDPAYNTRIDGLQTTVSDNALFKSTYPDAEISPLQLLDPFSSSRPSGYGTMAQITVSNTTLNTATNVWHTRVVCDGTCTVNVDSATHADVPDGAVFWVLSTNGVTTIAGTTSFTIDKFLGVGIITGSVTLAAGGWATVVKHSATKLHVTGVGVS